MNTSPDNELLAELCQISNSIEPYKPGNKFKAIVYNYAPKGHQVKVLQETKIQPAGDTGNYYQVDNSLFNEAIAKNPDPDRLYPWQINSCIDLSNRISTDSKTVDMFGDHIEKMDQSLIEIENNFNIKLADRIRNIAEGQNKLLEKLCATRQKFERFLEARKALSKDSGQEMRFYSRIEQLKKKLEIKSKIEKIDISNICSGRSFKIPEEQIESLVTVLQHERAGIAELRKVILHDDSKIKKLEATLEKYRNK